MGEFGVKNELGFVWFRGVVHFFSSDPCSLLPITWLLDL